MRSYPNWIWNSDPQLQTLTTTGVRFLHVTVSRPHVRCWTGLLPYRRRSRGTMTLNCPFQDDGAFDPDDIQHLADVFERACLALCNGRAQSSCIIRETIAARIIQAVWRKARMAHQKVTPNLPTAELPQIGAGEGNRTLVISLEGTWALSDFNARSDNWALIGHFER
jgi:hypothetical protein